ncbi:hypothetical protein [Candidatus Thiothrix anitrata]|jgi:quinol monooxygenase YgiN|uniref:DUF4398 domain-containing protein n=1 Tax=Candidatus Thiothrix anitrata TaxID=2823902 RepID=A0ABX7X698_9GAMM|nr:hypothetical protein [Candidatus Thiothrix anitrata]QTR51151.1 hypothetical protein J8380_06255 [Candidatus Thiothrix anitrata]
MADPVTSAVAGRTDGFDYASALETIRADAQKSLEFERGMAEINQSTKAEESAIQYQVARDNAIAQLIQTISRG